jgi:Leucine-rich repeat (LRR) protein
LIPGSVKSIEAKQIGLDSFKAIEIVKKSIASRAHIRSIDFSDNKIGTKFIELIVDCQELTKLESLDLRGNKIKKRESVRYLERLGESGFKVILDQ